MDVCITETEALAKILANRHKTKYVPFNEDVTFGNLLYYPFSNDWCKYRAKAYGISTLKYKLRNRKFLSLKKNLKRYDKVTLVFSDSDKAKANTDYLIMLLEKFGFEKRLILKTCVLETGNIIESKTIRG